ncbi:MAG TPA: ribonuclease G [Gammaproteobacteria bacterium]|nr:ribonuclease G [Gammaproteobacteria bacterium]
MSQEILINVTPQETRVAVVENGLLQEVQIERTSARGIVSNIYVGKVVRILPGMQAAFIDIGLERTAFLHASAIQANTLNGGCRDSDDQDCISRMLHDGQKLVVQVLKDPIGSKGARLTTQIAIPARYLVYQPFSSKIGVSQRIEHDQERRRLKDMVNKLRGEDEAGGYIIRTIAESTNEDDIHSDIQILNKIWQGMQQRLADARPGDIIYEDLPLALRIVRDMVRENIERVRIDSRETWETAIKLARELLPDLASRIEYYPGERPIFDLYSVEDEIQKGLCRTVPLKSGGHIVIDQTEAMTTIDVNTGTFVGHRNQEETIFKTNLESAQAIARQLRLRNLGGIIIIDFIDMVDEEHQLQVLRALKRGLARDHTKTSINEMTALGLVEVTRKRTRESLERILCEPCPVCSGRGVLKTAQTVCYEIFREILRESREYEVDRYRVLASKPVIELLLNDEQESLTGLQEFIRARVELQVDTMYTQEEYDVVIT